MAALIGPITGFPLVFVAIPAGIIFVGLVANFIALLRIKGWKEVIPFGHFLSRTTIANLFCSSNILN
ncbi:hypothetical protein ACFLW8_03000 [Chloroflexota bacterium]